MSKNLDEIDLKILAEIQADGRITNVELAKRVGISPPPCLRLGILDAGDAEGGLLDAETETPGERPDGLYGKIPPQHNPAAKPGTTWPTG